MLTKKPLTTQSLSTHLTQGFPLDTFPSWVRDMVLQVSQDAQAAVPIAGNLAMSLVSACIARNVYVVEGHQREPTSIWTMSLADPGERKTPVFNTMKRPLMESNLSTHIIDDTSVPRFIRRLASEGKLIGLSDEPVLLDQLTQASYIAPQSLLNSYNEETFVYDRCSSKTIHLQNPSLTLGLAGQPDVFFSQYRSKNGQRLRNSGFFDRMAIVMVQSLAGKRDHMRKQTTDCNDIAITYQKNIQQLASYFTSEAEHETNVIELCLSSKADLLRRESLQKLETEYADNEELKMIRGWLSKCSGFVLRLAANLYMMDLVAEGNAIDINNLQPISLDVMERAIQLLLYYRDQTIIWHQAADHEKHKLSPAAHLYNYMKKQGKSEWPKRELQQAMKHTRIFQEQGVFDEAIADLQNQNLISLTPSHNTRGPRTYTVHLVPEAA